MPKDIISGHVGLWSDNSIALFTALSSVVSTPVTSNTPIALNATRSGESHRAENGEDRPDQREDDDEMKCVYAHGSAADWRRALYFVANGGGAIVSTQLVSRDFTSPLCRNSMMSRSTQSGGVSPSIP